eukprot:GHVO01061818.1.p1 GENE.GHVO01061818.1~~GHVO01061818.1.p1  ORF type:complete len:122 (-),score=16.79 GHVO01061818.1:33-398(-)
MNQNINDMIDSVLNGSRDEFSSAFVLEVEDRINSNMIDKNVKVAQDIMKDNEQTEEAMNLSKTYTFRNSRDAKKFSKSAIESGIGKKNIITKEKIVSVSSMDSDMGEVLKFLAKDMNGKIK